MGKIKYNEDLDSAVRELGGDEDDLKLVEDADFSGSDFEDVDPISNDGDLNDEVENMWKQLNGGDVKPAKKTFEKEDTKNKNSRSETKPASEQKAKEQKSTEPKSKESKNDKSKEASSKDSKDSKDKASKEPKKVEVKPKPKPEAPKAPKATPPPVLSKKAKIEWEKYINSLKHPASELLIDSQKWEVNEALDKSPSPLPAEIIEALKQKATESLTAENQIYFQKKSEDREFTSSLEFLKNGTFYDQLGTLSILSTESPLHSIRFLENLSSKCEVKHRESACKALEVTKDLLVSHVMPDRRLKWFKDQPFELNLSLPTLMSWAFEDYLKRYFFKILQVMERLLSDTVENIRIRALNCVFDFFRQKPEQEANLMRLGLNKLGDHSGKVASRVKRQVMDVLQQHPGMKPIIATAVSEVLGRVSDYRTRYYAVDMLSEFILSNRYPALANQLIFIYLELFERLLSESTGKKDERVEKAPTNGKAKKGSRFRAKRGKKGGLKQEKPDENELEQQQHARLVAKIFTGLNRAFPFSNLDPAVFKKYLDTLYHMSHSPNVGTFIEALSFIFQLSKSSPSSGGNRYYRALYDSLLDGRLQASSKLAKYIHLLLKSLTELKKEHDEPQSAAFIKRILQIACNWSEVGAVASLIHTAQLSSFNDLLLGDSKPKADNEGEVEYDFKQRDPRYAHAETTKAWEWVLLQNHYHPTVVHYANNALAPTSEKIALDMPDIEQYTVNSFLSKWSYKNPKAKDTTRGGSIFQPLSGYTDINLGVRQEKKGDNTPASIQDWKSKSQSQVAPDERFLYEYFTHRPDRAPKKPEAKPTAEGDDDSDAESLADEEINEAMAQSGPGDELGGVDVSDADFSDSEEDGDLEAELDAAFNSDLEDEDDEGQDGEGDEDVDGFSAGEDVDGSEDGAIEGAYDDQEDDFTNFGGESSAPNEDSTEKDSSKKRKRWSDYPTFLDADQFEEQYGEKQNPPKKR